MAEPNEVTKQYRAKQRLSLRDFAEEINKKLINTSVTYMTVSRWELATEYYEPDPYLLLECIATYKDLHEQRWIALWAADCLKAMFPDMTSPWIKLCMATPGQSASGATLKSSGQAPWRVWYRR